MKGVVLNQVNNTVACMKSAVMKCVVFSKQCKQLEKTTQKYESNQKELQEEVRSIAHVIDLM